MVGLVEESVVRPRSDAHRIAGTRGWRAIIVTSMLFELTHLANVLAGATVLETERRYRGLEGISTEP